MENTSSTQTPLQTPDTKDQTEKPTQKKKLIIQAIVLFLSPFVLLISALVLFAVANLIFAVAEVEQGDILRSAVNILLYLLGAAGALMFIIGPILGVIRLVKALR